ncbi:MAG: sarcosine oxidase subunit gamma [Rhodobacter sp.]|nr:sarcosine oxidase subunit gamma [Rhodobacter sp.]MCY4242687.1 sarcosine oxidase subunit gamma [Rhodobacter sp.]
MGYKASFEKLPLKAIFDLKGSERALSQWIGAGAIPAFPSMPNRLSRANGMSLCHVGPGNWLLQADLEREDDLLAELRPYDAPADVSIVRISDTMVTFRVTGLQAAHVVAIGCPLDLDESVFSDDTVCFSEFFGQKALIARCECGYDLSVELSFGEMIEDYLTRALR